MSSNPLLNISETIQNAASNGAKAVAQGVQDAGRAARDGAASAADAARSAGKAAADAAQNVGKVEISPEQIQELLGVCYDKALNGVPGISRSLEDYVSDYTSRYKTPEKAAQELIKNQLIKCTTSGALSGAAGFFALPVTIAAIPANIANVLYVQLRMIAGVAAIGGYDVRTDQVQTLIYACLAGTSATDLLKEAGLKVGQKIAMGAIKKIPGEVLVKINQKVGFRLVTKFGQTGIVNLGKLVPVVGAVIGGAFDFGTTKIIADTAYKYFIDASTNNIVEDSKLSAEAEDNLNMMSANMNNVDNSAESNHPIDENASN